MAEPDAAATTPAPTKVEGVAEDAAAVALITGAFAVAETGDVAAGVADAVGVAGADNLAPVGKSLAKILGYVASLSYAGEK